MRILSFFTRLMAFIVGGISLTSSVFAVQSKTSQPITLGLPFEDNSLSQSGPSGALSTVIAELIKYAGLLAVIALMVTGIMLIVSYGNDEKVKTAKIAVAYALGGVMLTGAAYLIVSVINKFSF